MRVALREPRSEAAGLARRAWRTIQGSAAADPGVAPHSGKAWQRAPATDFSAVFGLKWGDQAQGRRDWQASRVPSKPWCMGPPRPHWIPVDRSSAGAHEGAGVGGSVRGYPPHLKARVDSGLKWAPPGQPTDSSCGEKALPHQANLPLEAITSAIVVQGGGAAAVCGSGEC